MPDWEELVRQRMSELNLPADHKEEVISELAAHLEDAAADSTGTEEAENRVINQVHWRRLQRSIERTKHGEGSMSRLTKLFCLPAIVVLFSIGLVLLFRNRDVFLQRVIWAACAALLLVAAASESKDMNRRTRSLWLPALATFFGASVSLMVMEWVGMKPQLVWMSREAVGHNALLLYWPWLATLPAFGAAGALLSRRASGAPRTQLAVGVSPALIMFTAMALSLPLALAIDGFHLAQLVGFGLVVMNWVAIPGFALLLGALPFLRETNTLERSEA